MLVLPLVRKDIVQRNSWHSSYSYLSISKINPNLLFTKDTKSSIKQKYLGIQKQVNNPTKPNGIMETIGKLNQSPPEKRMPQQPCPPMREEKRNAIEGPGREIRTINTTRGEGKESLNGQIDIRTQERRT